MFDGVDDYIIVNISTFTTYTAMAWVKNSTASSWSHIAWSSSGINYTNGLVDNPVQRPYNMTSTAIRIGVSGMGWFNGTIDEVKIVPYVLSASEVLALYNGTINNSNYIGKYARQGDFKSLVYYNSTNSFWNISLGIADTYSSRTGIVNNKNEINLSHPNLVSYWALDNNYLDATGRNNGTAYNGVNNATGFSSGAMRFDGVDDYVTLSNNPVLNFSVNFTYTAWISAKSIPFLSNIVGRADGGGATDSYQVLRLSSNAGGIVSAIVGNGTASIIILGTTPILINTWYFVTLVGNISNISLYVNGNLNTIGPAYSIYTKTDRGVDIGRFPSVGTQFFNGTIDEVLIYNTSLSNEEIKALYKSGLSQHADTNVSLSIRTANSYNLSDPYLVGLWGLNGNANDELGLHNGTVVGSEINLNNDSAGVVGTGLFNTGGDGVINFSLTGFPVNVSYTLSSWINPRATASDGGVVRRYVAYAPLPYIGTISGGYRCAYKNGASSTITLDYLSSTSILNKLAYIVCIANSSTTTMYIDGVLANSSTINGLATTTANSLTLASYNGTVGRINGTMDEVRIYNRTLSASEVLDLYNLGKTHIEWADWTDEGVISDGIVTPLSNYSNFMQYKSIFNSNSTSLSPYILNYSIGVMPVTYPYFTAIPGNASINYLQGLSVSFNGSDYTWNPISYSVNNTKFSINSLGQLVNATTLSGGVYNLLVNVTNAINNSNSTNYKVTVNKIAPNILALDSNVGWISNVPVFATITGSNCTSQLTCTLYQDGLPVSNPFTRLFSAGNYEFNYSTDGNENYSATSTFNTFYDGVMGSYNLSVNIYSGVGCKYKKLGYYNVNLPWLREEDCN